MGLLDDFEKATTINTDNGEPSYGPQDYKKNGFIVPAVPSADGNGLPSKRIKAGAIGKTTRYVAHWFVPEVGIIPMFINPQSISYTNTKAIQKERTKGGFIVQYWGEDLSELTLDGHTGSSGVEGLNVLFEVYRAEQYMFDSIALQMAADSSISGINDMMDSAIGSIGGLAGFGAGVAGAFGGAKSSTSVLPKDVPSLAAMATGIEFYYAGWVFRGYFNSMNITESVEKLGLFTYNIKFTVTQRRGYRTNQFGWQHSATSKPFGDGSSGSDAPLSFSSERKKLSPKNPRSEF